MQTRFGTVIAHFCQRDPFSNDQKEYINLYRRDITDNHFVSNITNEISVDRVRISGFGGSVAIKYAIEWPGWIEHSFDEGGNPILRNTLLFATDLLSKIGFGTYYVRFFVDTYTTPWDSTEEVSLRLRTLFGIPLCIKISECLPTITIPLNWVSRFVTEKKLETVRDMILMLKFLFACKGNWIIKCADVIIEEEKYVDYIKIAKTHYNNCLRSFCDNKS